MSSKFFYGLGSIETVNVFIMRIRAFCSKFDWW